MKALAAAFYKQDTIIVARDLLGKKLVHREPNGQILTAMISETEAYLGHEDPAAHSYNHRRTDRTETMYLDGGHAYIYFIYGIHYCFNVVTRSTLEPEAVLVRGAFPLQGIDLMKQRRPKAKTLQQLSNGPGKLCQAFALNRAQNGLSLLSGELVIEDYKTFTDDQIEITSRIGVDYAGDAAHWPLRFSVLQSLLI